MIFGKNIIKKSFASLMRKKLKTCCIYIDSVDNKKYLKNTLSIYCRFLN